MTARPRICFIVESGTDVRLVNGLAERATVTVLARPIPGGVAISRPPAPEVDVRLGPPGRAAFAARAARFVRREGRAFDHVLVQGYGPTAVAAGGAARLAGRPATLVVCNPAEGYYRCRRRNPTPGKPFHPAELALIIAVARVAARLAGRCVAMSGYLADVVRGHGTRAPVHVIPVYGVDAALFAPGAEPRGAVRARLGLPPSGPLLFYASRVAPEKDTRTLLRALRRLRAGGLPVTLLNRSGGWREFLAMAEAEGVRDAVIATDAVHPERELPDSYRAADLCVQASLDEGLGFSVLESLACGTPVVASAVGGLRETIVAGRTGWSVPPGDESAMAGAIAAALADPAEAARRAAEGRRMVIERFERRLVFDALFGVLQGT